MTIEGRAAPRIPPDHGQVRDLVGCSGLQRRKAHQIMVGIHDLVGLSAPHAESPTAALINPWVLAPS